MSWKSGSELMDIIVKAAQKAIPDVRTRRAFYQKVYKGFVDSDWDCEHAFVGRDPALDSVMKAAMKKYLTKDEIEEMGL